MSEIMPIPPSPPLPGVQKIEREKERKNNSAKEQPKDDISADQLPPQNDQPSQHIDEIV